MCVYTRHYVNVDVNQPRLKEHVLYILVKQKGRSARESYLHGMMTSFSDIFFFTLKTILHNFKPNIFQTNEFVFILSLRRMEGLRFRGKNQVFVDERLNLSFLPVRSHVSTGAWVGVYITNYFPLYLHDKGHNIDIVVRKMTPVCGKRLVYS